MQQQDFEELAGHPDLAVPDSIHHVHLSGLVLLQIARHAQDLIGDPSTPVVGTLLGFDANDTLDVLNSYAIPAIHLLEEDGMESLKQFHGEQMEVFRDARVIDNICGWYRAANFDELDSVSTWAGIVAIQAKFQKEMPNSVVIVYDHAKAAKGVLALRALRLSANFNTMYQKASMESSKRTEDGNPILPRSLFFEHKVNASDIFEEIPIKIKNSLPMHALLYELREDPSLSLNSERLELDTSAQLRKSMRKVEETIDDYITEQTAFLAHQKKVAKNLQERENYIQKRKSAGQSVSEEDLSRNSLFKDIPAPSRLNAFLMSNLLRESADQLSDISNLGFAKIYALQGLHKSEDLSK